MFQQFHIHQFPIYRLLTNHFIHISTRTNTTHTLQQINDKDDFLNNFHRHHIEINSLQKNLLTIGAGLVSLMNPKRIDSLACFGEITGESALIQIYQKMQNSQEGSEILNEKPIITTRTVDFQRLKEMPEGTLGKTYSSFLEKNKITPDSRIPVKFIDDVNLAYVLQRHREIHDLLHAVAGIPPNQLGEITIKWIEAYQTKLPVCISAAILGPLLLNSKKREIYKNYYLPWALETGSNAQFLLSVYFEKRWEQPVAELQEELNIKPLILSK